MFYKKWVPGKQAPTDAELDAQIEKSRKQDKVLADSLDSLDKAVEQMRAMTAPSAPAKA